MRKSVSQAWWRRYSTAMLLFVVFLFFRKEQQVLLCTRPVSILQPPGDLLEAIFVVFQQPALALGVVVEQLVLENLPSLGPLLGQLSLTVLDGRLCGTSSRVIVIPKGLGDISPDSGCEEESENKRKDAASQECLPLGLPLALLLKRRNLPVKHLPEVIKNHF